jgi:hypothetical protein
MDRLVSAGEVKRVMVSVSRVAGMLKRAVQYEAPSFSHMSIVWRHFFGHFSTPPRHAPRVLLDKPRRNRKVAAFPVP